VETGLGIISR